MNAVIDNAALQRYELHKEGQVAFADYRREKGTLYIVHVEAPVALRGTGAAGELMRGMMEAIKNESIKVIPICGYAAAWLQRHPEYKSFSA